MITLRVSLSMFILRMSEFDEIIEKMSLPVLKIKKQLNVYLEYVSFCFLIFAL